MSIFVNVQFHKAGLKRN